MKASNPESQRNRPFPTISDLINVLKTGDSTIAHLIGLYLQSISPEMYGLEHPNETIHDTCMGMYDRCVKSQQSPAIKNASKYKKYLDFSGFKQSVANGLVTDALTEYDLDQILSLLDLSLFIGTKNFMEEISILDNFNKGTEMDTLYTNQKELVEGQTRIIKFLKNLQSIAHDSYFKKELKNQKSLVEIQNAAPCLPQWIIKNILKECMFPHSLPELKYGDTDYISTIQDLTSLTRLYMIIIIRKKLDISAFQEFLQDTDNPSSIVRKVASLVEKTDDTWRKSYIIISTVYAYFVNYLSQLHTMADMKAEVKTSSTMIGELTACIEFLSFNKIITDSITNIDETASAIPSNIIDLLSSCSGISLIKPEKLSFGVPSFHNATYDFGEFLYSPNWLKETVLLKIKELRGSSESQEYETWLTGSLFARICEFNSLLQKELGLSFGEFEVKFNEFVSNNYHYAIQDTSDLPAICSVGYTLSRSNDIRLTRSVSRLITDLGILLISNMHIDDPRSLWKVNPVQAFSTYLSIMSSGILLSITHCKNHVIQNMCNIGILHDYRCNFIPMNKFQKENTFVINSISSEDNCSFGEFSMKIMHEIIARANTREITGQDHLSSNQRYHNMVKYIAQAISNNTITAEYAIIHICNTFFESFYKTENIHSVETGVRNVFSDIMSVLLKNVGERSSDFYKIFHNTVKTRSFVNNGDNREIDYQLDKTESDNILKAYVESIAFITILQNIAAFSGVQHDTKNLACNIFARISQAPINESRTIVGSIFSQVGSSIHVNTGYSRDSLLMNIRNAVDIFESTIQTDLSDDDWFERNRTSIIN